MSSKIRILPDIVINQIAAGEVIERPVAVVKELIENSIDAKATRIEITFKNGGKSYIRIEDNGIGMTPEEASISIERHATSKLKDASDLLSIYSFGFRGEALPSIASVSKFTLKTRTKDSDTGCEILINGGKWIHKRDCGMPQGTCIEVANLFNSVPARRKFLKTDNTEAAHIIYMTRLFSISHPSIAFTLIEDGRTIFRSPACKTLRERISETWSKPLSKDLVNLKELQLEDAKIWGMISKPGVGRSTRQEIVTIVNGRPVESKTLIHALLESYHTYLPKGKYPVAFIFLEINAATIDVNVHPAKREVRFRDEAKIRKLLINATLQTLEDVTEEAVKVTTINTKELFKPVELPRRNSINIEPIHSTKPILTASEQKPILKPAIKPSFTPVKTEYKSPTINNLPKQSVNNDIESFSWEYIGKLQNNHVIFETPAGVVILNTNAAYQRVRYEKILKNFTDNKIQTQPLLLPILLELDNILSVALLEWLDFLNENGFKIEEFGRNFFRIESLPVWLDPDNAEYFIKELSAAIREGHFSKKNINLLNETLSQLACKHTLSTKENLSAHETKLLAKELLTCKNPLNCPKGKLTYYEIPFSDIDKKLKLK